MHDDESPSVLSLENETVLVGIPLENLRDGNEVPPAVWEPLLGGELLPVWDALLPNEGDTLIVKGSTVLNAFFGVYPYNAETRSIPVAMRADIDVVLSTAQIENLLKNPSVATTQAGYAHYHEHAGVLLNFISSEDMRAMNINALNELQDWLTQSTLTPQELPRILELKKTVETASAERLVAIENLAPFQSMSLKLEKLADGSLEVRLSDPLALLSNSKVTEQLHRSQTQGVYHGIAYDRLNHDSPEYLYMQAFLQMPHTANELPEFTTKIPLYTLDVLARYIKTAAEMDAVIVAEEGLPQNMLSDYEQLVKMADLLAKGKLNFMVRLADKQINAEEWFTEKIQQAFVRGCLTNGEQAFTDMFMGFPLGKFVSAEIGAFFEEYQKLETDFPKNELLYHLAKHDVSEELNIAPIRATLLFNALMGEYYGAQARELTRPATELVDSVTKQVFVDAERYPQNMSEIMAVIFVSMDWNIERDQEAIDSVIDNWLPSGNITAVWKKQNVAFDASLDKEIIVEKMQEYEDFIERKRAE